MAAIHQPYAWPAGLVDVTEGPWVGWRWWGDADPYESLVGPFYYRLDPDGRARCAFRAETRHMNAAGFMHGGCLMSFADFAAFAIAIDELSIGPSVTVTCNCEFVGGVGVGALVEATGEVVRAGRSLVFIRGLVTADGEPAMTFSAVARRSQPRS